MQRVYKGRTNNHLSWVMVDATDFATPESALSAAMKIKIYGKLRGATGVNFVSSGTGSLTNDIQHVGASVLGIYTIALAKADLSDASAAWYDQYIVSLSATGAAYQTLVVEGVIDDSTMSALISDIQSAVLLVQSQASDAYSAIIAPLASMTSDVASAVWAHAVGTRVDSRILVAQSFLSDIRSNVSDLQSDFQSRVPKLVATNSQVSDLVSDVRSVLIVMSGIQSDIYSALSDFQSDFQSRVPKRVATDSQLSDMASDLKSAIAGITATVGASDISDIASAVWANTIGARVDSRILVAQSTLSDIRSHVSDLQSDFQSRVPKRVATDSQLSDLASDIKSAVAGITATVGASDISDIASAVRAALVSDLSDILSAAVQTNSRVLVAQSYLSDIRSHVSDLQSDFQSRVPKAVATNSQLSDLHSDLRSFLVVMSGVQSDVYSALSDMQSDFQSRVPKRVATDSQLSDLHSDLKSHLTVSSGVQSDIYSLISDLQSDFQSRVPKLVATNSQVSDLASDLKSHLTVSSGVQSDIYSLLSDIQSDFQSRVPKRVATDSQLSDLSSDVKSAIGALTFTLSASDISDIASAVVAGLPVTSAISDIYSLLQIVPTANQNADALLDRADAIETGLTLRGAMRLDAAALAGKLAGAAGTTVTIRNAVADSKDRITATVDASGNRTSVSTDVS